MNKILTRFGNVIATIALLFATMSANSTCRHLMYQDSMPEIVKQLNKIK